MSDKTKYTAENIQALEMSEHIRLRPGMYLGRVDSRGFITVISGIVCEILQDDNFKNELDISIEGDKKGTIQLKSAKGRIQNQWYRTKDNWNPTSGNLYFLELYVLNALCKIFDVELINNEGRQNGKENYVEGKPVGEIKKEYNCNSIIIHFELDDTIWGDKFIINNDYLNHQLKELAYLNSDLTVRVNYKVQDETSNVIHNYPNGLKDKFQIEQLNGLGFCYFESFIKQKIENIEIDVAYGFRDLTVDEPYIKSYVNHFYTSENGSHVDAILKGLTFGTMKYFQKNDLINKYKISEKGIRENLVALVHLKYDEPLFSGCVKNKLANPEIEKPISDFISEHFFRQILDDKDAAEKLIRNFEM